MNTDTKIQISVADIEQLPNYRKRTAKEYSSACPVCGGDTGRDTDRFRFWPDDGNFWCRQCNLSGFVTETSYFSVTPEIKAKWQAANAEAERVQIEKHKTAIETIQNSRNDLIYHHNLVCDRMKLAEIDLQWGITIEMVKAYSIGYCNACPTYPLSDSFTIPFYNNCELVNLRHRLISNYEGGKYRPEIAGLETTMYNSDTLLEKHDNILLVEGEFKAVYLSQYYDTVAISGVQQFQQKWAVDFLSAGTVYICFDPGTDSIAIKTGEMLKIAGNRVKIVTLPHKPDDFFVKYNGTKELFDNYLRYGRSI